MYKLTCLQGTYLTDRRRSLDMNKTRYLTEIKQDLNRMGRQSPA